MNDRLELRRQMSNIAQDAKEEARERELDELEADAHQMGYNTKVRHLAEKRAYSDTAIMAFATGLAQIYLNKDLERLERYDAQKRALLFVSFFMRGYEETKVEIEPL